MPPVERLICEPAEWCEATWGSQGSEIDRSEQLECAMVGDGLKQSWNKDQNRHGGAEGPLLSLLHLRDTSEPTRDDLPSKASQIPLPCQDVSALVLGVPSPAACFSPE